MFKGWIAAAFTLIVWGVTFVNTRMLLTEFSALEILLLRFSLAWGMLALIGLVQRKRCGWQGRNEALFAFVLAEPTVAPPIATNVLGSVHASWQCHSVTKSGNRCKRKAAPSQLYCKQHAASTTVKQAPASCCYLDDAGVRCKAKALDGKRYCAKHLTPAAAMELLPSANHSAE